MEYKYPKKITVGDTVFHIIYDKKNDDGANLSYPVDGKKAFVRFGMKHIEQNPLTFLMYVIHEFKEILHIEQATRYAKMGENDRYEFHYNHAEHSDLCCRLSGIIDQFIK